jgi:hypothetical protein
VFLLADYCPPSLTAVPEGRLQTQRHWHSHTGRCGGDHTDHTDDAGADADDAVGAAAIAGVAAAVA